MLSRNRIHAVKLYFYGKGLVLAEVLGLAVHPVQDERTDGRTRDEGKTGVANGTVGDTGQGQGHTSEKGK